MKSTYQRMREKKQKNDSFWVEALKIDFVVELTQLLRRREFTYSKLAEKMGKSPAYISKVFAGDENLTMESMVKLVRALNGKLHFHVADDECDVRWLEILQNRRIPERHSEYTRVGKPITDLDHSSEYYAAA